MVVFYKHKTANEMATWLEFRRVLFRSSGRKRRSFDTEKMELRCDILCFQITLQECKIEPAAEPRFKYAERSFFCQSVQEAGLLKLDMAALCHSSVEIVVVLVVLFLIERTE